MTIKHVLHDTMEHFHLATFFGLAFTFTFSWRKAHAYMLASLSLGNMTKFGILTKFGFAGVISTILVADS